MVEGLIVLHGDSSLGVSERDMESEDRLSILKHMHTEQTLQSIKNGKKNLTWWRRPLSNSIKNDANFDSH